MLFLHQLSRAIEINFVGWKNEKGIHINDYVGIDDDNGENEK